ncbi:flagellar hook-associated protein 2 [Bacillota bacterium Lsc_1132]
MVSPISGSNNIASQYSGLMRLNGFSSGLDIDGMVSQLMKAERIPLDKLDQKKQIIEWQRDDYRSMYSSLDELDQTIFSGIGMQSTFNKKTVTSSDDSKVSASAVNALSNMSASISVSQLATSSSWKGTAYTAPSADTNLQFTVTDPGSTTTRTVNISISSTDTEDSVIAKFNNSNLGVSLFKDSSGALVMSNNLTGTGGVIKANDQATIDFMQNSFGMAVDANSSFSDTNATIVATDAKITFNGYSMTQKSNNFTINGINYTIKNITSTAVNISTATDVDSIFNSIKSFVDKYNDTIKKVNDKISEKRNRDFQPLTDEQRSTMTENQITLWEEKAKSGMLSNDSVLSSGLSKMRQDLYSPVSGGSVTTGFTQLSEIGITTSPDYTENGKLLIDETTLRQKIQENPQAIYQLFNSDGGTYDTKGIAKRLRDSLAATKSQIVEKAGKASYTNTQFTLGKQLNDISTQITDFQSRLADVENRYYRQFTAMEQAMQQANSQAGYIAQQFGG